MICYLFTTTRKPNAKVTSWNPNLSQKYLDSGIDWLTRKWRKSFGMPRASCLLITCHTVKKLLESTTPISWMATDCYYCKKRGVVTKGVLLQHVNAWEHTCRITVNAGKRNGFKVFTFSKLEKSNAWTPLTVPLCLPDSSRWMTWLYEYPSVFFISIDVGP